MPSYTSQVASCLQPPTIESRILNYYQWKQGQVAGTVAQTNCPNSATVQNSACTPNQYLTCTMGTPDIASCQNYYRVNNPTAWNWSCKNQEQLYCHKLSGIGPSTTNQKVIPLPPTYQYKIDPQSVPWLYYPTKNINWDAYNCQVVGEPQYS